MNDNTNFNKGQKLIIELTNECFIGELCSISKDRTRIELNNVENCVTKQRFSGKQKFYKPNIVSITPIQSGHINNDESGGSSTSNIPSESDNSGESCPTPSKLTNITYEEYDKIQETIQNFQYFQQTDHKYHEAISDLSQQVVIGLSVENTHIGRFDETAVLTASTENNIYIFDILSIGQVTKELKKILESTRPRKIIHDCTLTADNLLFRQGVKLSSLFDTMVAHISLGYDKRCVPLNKCISTHFKLPEKMSDTPEQCQWAVRPLDHHFKLIAAQNVGYLVKLQEYFINEHFLKNFYDSCELYANSIRSNKDIGCDIFKQKSKHLQDNEFNNTNNLNINFTKTIEDLLLEEISEEANKRIIHNSS